MSYDPNSPEAKIGKWGEEIVKKWLEKTGFEVTRPDDNEKSLMDFVCVNSTCLITLYAEAKVRKSLPYAHGQYPCYAFPTKQIEAYKAFLWQNFATGWLLIIDPESKELLVGSLNNERSAPFMPLLEEKVHIDCKEFPFDQDTKIGDMRFYHRNQFKKIRDLSPKEIKAFDNFQAEISRANNNAELHASELIFGKEEPPEEPSKPAIILKQLADIVSVDKQKIAQFILDLRLKEFEQEQEQLRQLLLQGG